MWRSSITFVLFQMGDVLAALVCQVNARTLLLISKPNDEGGVAEFENPWMYLAAQKMILRRFLLSFAFSHFLSFSMALSPLYIGKYIKASSACYINFFACLLLILGHRLGASTAPHTLEVYLDYVASQVPLPPNMSSSANSLSLLLMRTVSLFCQDLQGPPYSK
jgi:hypothetical protein